MILDKRRLYLFSTHFSISFVIFLILIYIIFYRWYPHHLFFTSGGWHGTKIVFLVDMVLGPALTFILSSPSKEKPELTRDLCFCALMQIGALAYGVSLLINTKPSFLSIHAGAIHVIQSDHIENAPDKTLFNLNSSSITLVYSDDINKYDLSLPEFKTKAETILAYGRDYGIPVHAVPETFDSIINRKAELDALTAESLKKIKRSSKYTNEQLETIRKENWFITEIDGSFKNGYAAFDQNGKIHESICCH